MASFFQVELSDIRSASRSDLESSKLNALESSYDSFEDQVNNCREENAICLSGSKPYDIINGRHRVFLAREKGWKSVKARFS
jgi:hypothetical protein